jgi:NADH:ubiquinone oxidoreductase subunit E
MFHQERRGTNQVLVCTNVACMLKGGNEILRHVEKRLGIRAGETTSDGAFTIVEEECLAACANAPMMICGNDYFLDLTPEKVDEILDELRKRHEAREARKVAGGSRRDESRDSTMTYPGLKS